MLSVLFHTVKNRANHISKLWCSYFTGREKKKTRWCERTLRILPLLERSRASLCRLEQNELALNNNSKCFLFSHATILCVIVLSWLSVHFYNYPNKGCSSFDRSTGSNRSCVGACSGNHADCVPCAFPTVATLNKCAITRVCLTVCVCQVADHHNLIIRMWQKMAGSSLGTVMKPGRWLIGDTMAWGNPRGSYQAGRRKGGCSSCFLHTTEFSLSCSFVEHAGEDNYTGLVRIPQMQIW